MISVEQLRGKSAAARKVEVVERKGIGHPDFICDSVMEAISVALSMEYKRLFGAVLHHNIDKGLLAAGKARKRFGGGEVVRPMELIIGDRATFSAGGKKIPVNEIAFDAAKKWLKESLRFVDPERHVTYRSVLAEGSEELTDIFKRGGRARAANDTSAAVGYFPLSPTEEAVLALERYLNSKSFKKKFPDTGEDVKVMGLRTASELDLTVAMPLMARFIKSETDYFGRKEKILEKMEKWIADRTDFERATINYNTLDERGRGLGGVYLSLLGTSAEDADSGQVGRGNRVNGLISVGRPMGTEAAAGKNPASHVGKIYNVLAHRAAEKIYGSIEGIEEVYVLLLSRIGAPVDKPLMASAQVLLKKGVRLKDVSKKASLIIESELSAIPRLSEELAEGRYSVC